MHRPHKNKSCKKYNFTLFHNIVKVFISFLFCSIMYYLTLYQHWMINKCHKHCKNTQHTVLVALYNHVIVTVCMQHTNPALEINLINKTHIYLLTSSKRTLIFFYEINSIPITVVVPRGATSDAGENPQAEKFPISPRTINIRPTLKTHQITTNQCINIQHKAQV